MALSVQSDEELLLVKEMMILPVMIEVLERDIHIFANVKFKFPHLYAGSLRVIQDAVSGRLSEIRRQCRKRGIRVLGTERTREYIQAKYRAHGYEHSVTLLWELVRTAIEERLASYLNVRLDNEKR